jgi:hypothetical protein
VHQPLPPPIQQTPQVPSIYAVFDAFELASWEGSSSTKTSNNIRVSSSRSASRGGGSTKKDGGGGGKGKKWRSALADGILGMEYPGPIGEYPFGPSGEPPAEQSVILPDKLSQPVTPRPLRYQPVHEMREPLYFGPTRRDIPWEPSLSYETRSFHQLRIDTQFEADVPRTEEITLDKWYTPFSRPGVYRLLPPLNMEVFPGHTTRTETPQVDKWDSPLTTLLPWRPKLPVGVMPVLRKGQPPLGENVTLDKWWTPLSDPVRTPPWLTLAMGVLFPVPLLDDPEVALARLQFRHPHRLPAWPRTYQVLPEMETFPGHTTREEAPQVDKWDSPLTRLTPWRPKMPVSVMPYHYEGPEPEGENITLDKWYTALSVPAELLVPYALQQFEADLWVATAESVTVDKYHEALSLPVPPSVVLQLPLGVMPEEPLPDEPGVTYSYWFAAPQQPLAPVPVLPVLYQPLQRLEREERAREVPWPRRRIDSPRWRRR